jgi:hypothetical protein
MVFGAEGLAPRAQSLSMPGVELMPDDWKTYRTRFLVRAKQLTEPLTFTDPLGREHSGSPGDYLVESNSGLLRIAAKEIFEDVYVPLAHTTVIPNRAPQDGERQPYVNIHPSLESAEDVRPSTTH